ncbi:Uncharacterised protein [Mycobacterium tuberculosis]|uniref:Uncharacterized protein n=1 Tax=Mycobacterium tuberculosis TaxID=1773 RepID=A0A654ZIQ4_MYCTX|nr:Uncharacterised protein [Mycobacterium tuberculosis]CNV09488.1 Uncharacterised protein [Mycobacterium tuberculosis]CNV36810.1 Uncharacterised protein [Mycobacterium tuberculosis]CNV40200.1 Uncharacterised protein [Mycobacterium tuberculosis]CNV72451.1 Uncharacterised protein [Mycobacterium tuberculosis]
MFATAIRRYPSATCSGDRSSPVRAAMSAARSVKPRRTVPASSGWSPEGPNTDGKWVGWMRPSITLASVTHSGPPPR